MLNNKVKDLFKTYLFPILILIFILGYVITESLIVIKNGDIWYDESYNLQVPTSLVKHHLYATSYSDKLTLFDPLITTGASVLVPISLTFSIFGISIINARLVMLFLFISFLVITYLFVTKKSGWGMGALSITIPLILFGPELLGYSLRVFGEISALLFLLLGILFYKHPKISGVLMGLSIMTKIQLIFVFIPLIIIFIIRKKLKQSTKNIKTIGIYSFITLIGWELVQIFNLGLSVYLSNKLILGKIIIYSGFVLGKIANYSGLVKDTNIYSAPTNFLSKLDLASETFNLSTIVFVLLVLIVIYMCIKKLKSWLSNKKKKDNNFQFNIEQLIILSTGWVYFFWWLIAGRNWFRHLFPSILLIIIFLLIFAHTSFNKSSRKYLSVISKVVSIASLIFLVLHPISTTRFRLIPPPLETLSGQICISNWIRENLQDTQIFYNPLWENTELSFLIDRSFLEVSTYQQKNDSSKNVIVITPSEKYWSENELKKNKFIKESNKIYSSGGYDIYNLLP